MSEPQESQPYDPGAPFVNAGLIYEPLPPEPLQLLPGEPGYEPLSED